MQPGYQQGSEPMWWWKVAQHLDDAQLALANAMSHNVDDPRLMHALYDRLRDGQAILLKIFRAKGLLPEATNGTAVGPMPSEPMAGGPMPMPIPAPPMASAPMQIPEPQMPMPSPMGMPGMGMPFPPMRADDIVEIPIVEPRPLGVNEFSLAEADHAATDHAATADPPTAEPWVDPTVIVPEEPTAAPASDPAPVIAPEESPAASASDPATGSACG